MSDHKDWSPSYTAWKLMEIVLESRTLKPVDLEKDELLELFSDCANAVQGEYLGGFEGLEEYLEDIDDDIDDGEFDEDDLIDDE